MDPLESLRRVPDALPADDVALARARARLMARAAVADRGAGRVPRRAVLVGAAAAVAGGLVAGGVVALPRRASASGLATAAAEVTDPRLLPGQYLRVTTLHDEFVQGGPSRRTVQVVWVPWDRRRTWVQRTTTPDGAVHTLRAVQGALPAVQDYESIELIVRVPGTLRQLEPDWIQPGDPSWSCDGVTWAQSLLDSGEVPAPVRAQIYHYLQSLAGVHQHGTATLASGRTGTVFAADDKWRSCRWELVIDERSGDYLGARCWDTGVGTPPGGFLLDARALTTAIVGSAP